MGFQQNEIPESFCQNKIIQGKKQKKKEKKKKATCCPNKRHCSSIVSSRKNKHWEMEGQESAVFVCLF